VTSPIDTLTGPPFVVTGRIVTMNDDHDVIADGRIYIDKGTIKKVVGKGGAAPDGFTGAPVVETGGTIYPGLIELHNHLPYNVLPMWVVPRPFTNRGQWIDLPDKRRLISGPMQLLGAMSGTIEAVVRYTEAKCLVSGVTTSQGITLVNQNGIAHQYRGVVRNVEQTDDDELPEAVTHVADVKAAAAFLTQLERGKTTLLHLSEGIDETARKHFLDLRIAGRKWAITKALGGIHCTGLKGRDFATLRSRGGSMVWSPFSNLLLYGGTAPIDEAIAARTNIALGSDWSPSGSKNLLGELKAARIVIDVLHPGLTVSDRDIVDMVTRHPATILRWDNMLGSLQDNARADLLVVDGTDGDDYSRLIGATESAVKLVVVNGVPRYGTPSLLEQVVPSTETLKVGGDDRVLNLATDVVDPLVPAIKFSEARARLTDAMGRLPQIADALADPMFASGAIGLTADSRPGTWVLDLDNDHPGDASSRALAPMALLASAMAGDGALGQVLSAVTLDPLTVVDDDEYFGRVGGQTNLRRDIAEPLAAFYGASLPDPPGPAGAQPADPVAARRTAPAIREFLATTGNLTLAERKDVVDQSRLLLEEVYVHLGLKRAMHAVEPIQRLRLLRYGLDQTTDATMGAEAAFHREMTDIFTELRDLHTNYLLPSPYRENTAYLPFLVEEYTEADEAHYLVSKVADDLPHPTFVAGVELTHWNGVPIHRAIEISAERNAGSNDAARFARGLDSLTIRPLMRLAPPDEEWVVVRYIDMSGADRELRVDWKVWAPGDPGSLPMRDDAVATRAAVGYDVEVDSVNVAKKVLFAPAAVRAEERARSVQKTAVSKEFLETTLPTVLRANPVPTPSGTFGYIRVFTFMVDDADAFVAEFVRLVDQLPDDGLIIDVRNNGGGLIYAAEQLLQTLTPRAVDPSPAQFVTTPLMLDLVRRHSPSPLDPTFDLSPWADSMDLAVRTGSVYSSSHSITPTASANAVGQRYHGPVVLVTDARCYSATDMFAAGFQDHRIGPVLGVHANTGAGGANVWTHELLRRLMDAPAPPDSPFVDNPFTALPANMGLRVAVRRTVRVGDRSGTPVEDLGVVPDERHAMTRRDLLEGNADLIEHAGRLLAGLPRRRLDAKAKRRARQLTITLTTVGVDRVDVAVAGRPVTSVDVRNGTTEVVLERTAAKGADIGLQAFAAGTLTAALHLPAP
jgi:cytosine/adenosine deaminase-related metal-dependent hydrolase/C-terminal processing protease CtpA/Prc